MREKIAVGEFYHVYNRGVDKRNIFKDKYDFMRFYESMREFNDVSPIGSLYLQEFRRPTSQPQRLVNVVAFCINPNHFHFILEALTDDGISEFMKRLSGGYTKYFNHKHERSGALFQGKYKYQWIDSDAYLRHLSVYVNRNIEIHGLRRWTSQWGIEKTSNDQYVGENTDLLRLCEIQNQEIVLEQFKDSCDYNKYSEEVLIEILENREEYKDML